MRWKRRRIAKKRNGLDKKFQALLCLICHCNTVPVLEGPAMKCRHGNTVSLYEFMFKVDTYSFQAFGSRKSVPA
jgi:hypothetical protein